ncbi:MAG: four helix bundle protein [Patescibacteria group bacterium]|jgi:four helix bundle protein
MLETKNKKYDLEERTAIFGENIIKLCKSTKTTINTEPIIKQILRSATSIGANYMEANGASSKKDFCNKIYICKKEAQETKHWLRMLLTATNESNKEIDHLLDEAQQLSMIFHKITISSKNKV